MRRQAGPWFAAALLLTAASTSAGEVSDYDRFQLWNECRPMQLHVHILPDGATAIGLTEDDTEVPVRSRLRAAGLYSEVHSETAGASLFVNVRVFGPAFSTALEYWKVVHDLAAGLENRATTWYFGTVGTHERNSSGIVAAVAEDADKFIDEYLRVNKDACE